MAVFRMKRRRFGGAGGVRGRPRARVERCTILGGVSRSTGGAVAAFGIRRVEGGVGGYGTSLLSRLKMISHGNSMASRALRDASRKSSEPSQSYTYDILAR